MRGLLSYTAQTQAKPCQASFPLPQWYQPQPRQPLLTVLAHTWWGQPQKQLSVQWGLHRYSPGLNRKRICHIRDQGIPRTRDTLKQFCEGQEKPKLALFSRWKTEYRWKLCCREVWTEDPTDEKAEPSDLLGTAHLFLPSGIRCVGFFLLLELKTRMTPCTF